MPEDTLNKLWNVSKRVETNNCTKKLRPIRLPTAQPKSSSKFNLKEKLSVTKSPNIKKWVIRTYLSLKSHWKSKNLLHSQSFAKLQKCSRNFWCSSKQVSVTSVVESIRVHMKISAKLSWISKQEKVWKCLINIVKLQNSMKDKVCTSKSSNVSIW